jgi:hypothetical protein
LVLNGNYAQSAEGTLTLDVGPNPGAPATIPLQITGSANLSGSLTVQATPGFPPDFGAILKNAVTFGAHTGQWTSGIAQNLPSGRIFRTSVNNGADVVFGAEAPLAVGVNVTALAGDTSVSLPMVAQEGVLRVFPLDPSEIQPPAGVALPGKTIARDVGAQATFNGPVRVCLPVAPELQGSGLQLYHLEGQTWVNRTVPAVSPGVVCAEASSSGAFAQMSAGSAKPGDLNGDGAVTIQDATLALRFLVGLVSLTPDQIKVGDMNGDGALRIQDVNAILRRALGLR